MATPEIMFKARLGLYTAAVGMCFAALVSSAAVYTSYDAGVALSVFSAFAMAFCIAMLVLYILSMVGKESLVEKRPIWIAQLASCGFFAFGIFVVTVILFDRTRSVGGKYVVAPVFGLFSVFVLVAIVVLVAMSDDGVATILRPGNSSTEGYMGVQQPMRTTSLERKDDESPQVPEDQAHVVRALFHPQPQPEPPKPVEEPELDLMPF